MTPSEVARKYMVSLVLTILLLSLFMVKWKQIDGYDKYFVSNDGRVKTTDFNHTGQTKILSTFINAAGYVACNLMQNGIRHRKLVHRLVGFAFKYDSWFPLATINHKDLDKTNNNDWNLEWSTILDNLKHGRENQKIRYAKGENHYSSKLSTEQIKDLKYQLLLGIKGREIAENFGVSEKYVSAIKTGHSRKYESI